MQQVSAVKQAAARLTGTVACPGCGRAVAFVDVKGRVLIQYHDSSASGFREGCIESFREVT